MLKYLKELLLLTGDSNDIVRFVRTEYRKECQHLDDPSCIHFYNSMMRKKRSA